MSEQIKKLCEFKNKEFCECVDIICFNQPVFFDKALSKFLGFKRYPNKNFTGV